MNTRVTIRYTSGREEQFDVDVFSASKSAGIRLQEFVKDPTLLLQTDSELILIPAAAIECISLALPEAEGELLALPNVRKAQRYSPPAEGEVED